MNLENLLEIRRKLKDKKPTFIRQDTHKRKRLALKWRKPKGIHSKIRHHFKGRSKMPSPGYKSPSRVKGLHDSGIQIINVSSTADLQRVKRESEGIVVSKTVGTKKKLSIFKIAKELNIKILNLNVDQQIKNIEDNLNSKKKKGSQEPKKEGIMDKKESKHQPITEVPLSDEQKKEEEKKEKDKLLTKKV